MLRIAGQTRRAGTACGWKLHACGRGEGAHDSPRATDLRPYAVLVFSAALHPARDKVPRRISCPQDRKTCGSRTLRGSFLHKWSSDTLAASFSFFFFPQRKRTKAFCLFQKGGWCSFLARTRKERKECATVPVDRICAKGLLLHAAPDTCLRRLRCASHGGTRSAITKFIFCSLRLRARESSAVSVCVRVPPAARSFASADAAVLFCIRLF